MYSIIESGGFQQKVVLGETIKVPKIDAAPGSDISISQVLLWANGDDIQIGTPYISESSVTAEVLTHGKSDKIKVFKRKRRKGFRRTMGHRQQFTEILIKEFVSDSKSQKAEEKVLLRERARSASLVKQKTKPQVEPEISTENTGS